MALSLLHSFVFSCLNSIRFLGNYMSLADPKENGWALKTVFSVCMVKLKLYRFLLWLFLVLYILCVPTIQSDLKWKVYLTIVCACHLIRRLDSYLQV